MIAEILKPTEHFEGAVRYNFNKVNNHNASVLYSSYIKRDPETREHTAGYTIQSFYDLIPSDTRTKKPVFHVSLNPHPDEKLSDEDLVKISQEYMRRMGYGEQPYIVFKHFDIDREHIHIISSRVNTEGKKIDHNHERYKSKKITEDLETKYNLRKKAAPEDKKLVIPQPVDHTKGNIRHNIYNVVKYVLNKYNFQSVGEMNLALKRFNVQAELTTHQSNGKEYKGLFYYVTTPDGERAPTPAIQAYKVSRGVSYNSVRKHFEKSKKTSPDKLTNIKFYIDNILKNKPTEREFVESLKKESIDCIIRYTQDGSRIYGITFLSDEMGIVANGSRLGKDYSANAFNRLFNGEDTEVTDTIYKDHFRNESTADFKPKEEYSETLYDDFMDSNIMNTDYEDRRSEFEEDLWHRKLRRKKKKKRKKL